MLPTLPGCPPMGKGGAGWESCSQDFGMAWGIPAARMDGWMDRGVSGWVDRRWERPVEACALALGARREGPAWVQGCPLPCHLGTQKGEWLWSPKLTPSE